MVLSAKFSLIDAGTSIKPYLSKAKDDKHDEKTDNFEILKYSKLITFKLRNMSTFPLLLHRSSEGSLLDKISHVTSIGAEKATHSGI